MDKLTYVLTYKLFEPNGKQFDNNKTFYSAYIEAVSPDEAKALLKEEFEPHGLKVEIVNEPQLAEKQLEQI